MAVSGDLGVFAMFTPRRSRILRTYLPSTSQVEHSSFLNGGTSISIFESRKSGMKWGNLSDSFNGMKEVLIIMFVEWLLVLLVAYYVDRGISSGMGLRLCLPNWFNKKSSNLNHQRPSLRKSRTGDYQVEMLEKPDLSQEREKVDQLVKEGRLDGSVICDDISKVYPGRDGNPTKAAVKGLSLALSQGECFGMLGPNGAGKTSFISMMIGLSKPSSGRAFVDGNNILTQMDQVYTSMGVCPQHE